MKSGLSSVACLVTTIWLVPTETSAQLPVLEETGGPLGGVMQCFADDRDGNILAGTYFGGVFRSTSQGESWQRLSYGPWDVRAIATNNANDTFIGTASQGVWRSTDAGASFTRLSNTLSNRTVTAILVNPNTQEIFAGCTGGSFGQVMFRSTDNGSSFALVPGFSTASVYSIVMADGPNMLAGIVTGGVMRSTDNGGVWSNTNPLFPAFSGLSLAKGPGGAVYVCGNPPFVGTDTSRVFKSTDNGASWQLVLSQAHPSGSPLRTISASGDTVVVAGGTNVFISTNGGTDWSDRSPAAAASAGAVRVLGGDSRPVIATFSRQNVIGLGTAGRGPLLTPNAGLDWLKRQEGFSATHITAGTTVGSSVVVATQFDGLFIHGGTTYAAAGAGLPDDIIRSVTTSPGSGDVYAATLNNGLYKSVNGGDTFDQVLAGKFQAVYGQGTGGVVSVFTGGQGPLLQKSTDSGGSWSPLNTLGENITGICAHESGGLDYIEVATGPYPNPGGPVAGDGVRQSTDEFNWVSIGPPKALTSLSVAHSYGRLVTTSDNEIYERSFNDQEWKILPALGGVLRASLAYELPGEPVRWVVGTNDGVHYREANSAGSWSQIDPPLGTLLWKGLEMSALCYFAIAGGGQGTNSPAQSSGELFVGTYGAGLFKTSRAITSVRAADETLPGDFSLAQNYPNPFNPITLIRYEVPEIKGQGSGASAVKLLVYDILGREVTTVVNEQQKPGVHTVQFDASGLASGVYVYRLIAGHWTGARKMMVLK